MNKLLYRTVKGITILNYLYDLDNYKLYNINGWKSHRGSGYFTIKPGDNNTWWVVKKLGVSEFRAEKYITFLPKNEKNKLLIFLFDNFGTNKELQKIYSLLLC